MIRESWCVAFLVGSLSFASSLSAGDEPGPATILQTLAVFDRPESCAFSLDGEHLFVGNCGSDSFGPDGKKVGFVARRGSISKLAVARDGTVSVTRRHFVDGLDGPLGLAVLPIATERYPRGTLLVAQGLALLCEPDGTSVTNAEKLGTAVLFFDPESGARLGALELGVGSDAARVLGGPVLMPNSLAFDGAGNLYVTDSGRGGDRLVPPVAPRPGLVRVPHGSIDDPARGGFELTPIPGIPNGVGYWPAEDAVCVVTMGGAVPGGEALYYIPVSDFPVRETPEPRLSGIGTMDGITFTPAGTVLVSRFSGDLLAIPREGEPFPLRLDPETPLVAPADHRAHVLADGTCIIAVPEQARTELPAGSQRVRILRLPAGL
jgi:DNA-binding beta-propeller fold protein YncE